MVKKIELMDTMIKGKKRLIHLYCGEADTDGYVHSCCNKDIELKYIREIRTKYITCKKCLKEDDKYGN